MSQDTKYLYTRVSRESQTREQQIAAVKAAYPPETKWQEFGDDESGWKGIRSDYELLKRLIAKGQVHELAVFSVNRTGRNVREGAQFIALCQKFNVRVRCITEGLDFSGPMGFALWTIFSALGQMDSDRKSLAIKAKFRLKKEKDGWQCHGSPPHTFAQKIIDKAEEAYIMIDRGQPYRHVAKMLGISEHTVGRLLKWRGKPLISRQQFGQLFPGWQNWEKEKIKALTQEAVILKWQETQEAA